MKTRNTEQEADYRIEQEKHNAAVLQSQPNSPTEVNNYNMTDMDKFIALSKLKEEARENADKFERQRKKAWAEYFRYKEELLVIEKKLQKKEEASDEEIERNCKRLKKELLDC